MTDPIPGQMQLLSVTATLPSRIAAGELPQYEDIVLTAEQVEEAAREWPAASSAQQISYMRLRILAKLRHEVVADPVTGRRAFGGPQPGSGVKKKRLDERLVDAAEQRQEELINAAFSSVGPENSPELRHKSALNIVKLAQDIKKIEMAEDELERASSDEVRQEAAKVIAEMFRKGELRPEDLSEIVSISEADVVET